MTTTNKWAIGIGVSLALLGIYYFSKKKLYKLYVDNTKDGKPYICYDAGKGANCVSIHLAENKYTDSGDIGIEGFSYKADLNAERNSVKVTLYDKNKKEVDTITTIYK